MERFIGTLQADLSPRVPGLPLRPMNVTEMRAEVAAWLKKYRHYRPRASPDFLTPAEFSASLGKPIPQSGVSYM